MTWVGTAVMGIGSAASAYGSYRSAKKSSENQGFDVDPYGAINPEQRSMLQAMSPQITDRASNQSQYGGQYTTGPTADEQATIARQGRLSAMGEGWSDQFQPGQVNQEVNDTNLRQLNQQFYGDGLTPGAKALAEEQFAGTGGYWGDARAKGVMDTYGRTVTDPHQQFRSDAIQNSYNNALNYQQGQGASNQLTGQMQALPREIQQYGLDKQYGEWTRGKDEMAAYTDKALQFMGISTGTATPKNQGSPDALSYALGGVGNALTGAGMMQFGRGNKESRIDALNMPIKSQGNIQPINYSARPTPQQQYPIRPSSHLNTPWQDQQALYHKLIGRN